MDCGDGHDSRCGFVYRTVHRALRRLSHPGRLSQQLLLRHAAAGAGAHFQTPVRRRGQPGHVGLRAHRALLRPHHRSGGCGNLRAGRHPGLVLQRASLFSLCPCAFLPGHDLRVAVAGGETGRRRRGLPRQAGPGQRLRGRQHPGCARHRRLRLRETPRRGALAHRCRHAGRTGQALRRGRHPAGAGRDFRYRRNSCRRLVGDRTGHGWADLRAGRSAGHCRRIGNRLLHFHRAGQQLHRFSRFHHCGAAPVLHDGPAPGGARVVGCIGGRRRLGLAAFPRRVVRIRFR